MGGDTISLYETSAKDRVSFCWILHGVSIERLTLAILSPFPSRCGQTGVDDAFGDLVTRVVMRQIELDREDAEGDGKKKKKNKIKAPKAIKGLYKGGKMLVKKGVKEDCRVS